jgi:hypothetical protein
MKDHSIYGSGVGPWLVEYLAYWEEELTAARLGRLLGLSREHAQRAVLGPFLRDYHVPLERSRGQARRLADKAEGLRFAPTRPSDLVRVLQGMQILHTYEAESSPFGVPVEDVEVLTSAEPDVEVFKALYAACARRSAQVVEYQSRDQLFTMAFSPHAIVTAPGRLHFRGYADYPRLGTGGYIDVVPSRIRRIDGERPDLAVSSAGDVEWATRADLRFQLNPDLPESLRAVVLEEWSGGVTSLDGRLVLTLPAVRQALALYVRRGLRHRVFRSMAHEVWLPLSVEKDGQAPSA